MKHKNIERVKDKNIFIKINTGTGVFELNGKSEHMIKEAIHLLEKLSKQT